jgi:glycosyltransferase involved in cell wall biosynthesis
VVDQSENPKPITNCNHIITDTLGPCVSRNLGAKKAKGDILVFLDDDARIYSNFIREITKAIIEDRFDAVSGAVCDPEGNYLRKEASFLSINNENFIKVLTSSPDSEKSRISLAFAAGCSAIKKSVYEKVGGFEEQFDPTGAGEDREMALKLYKNCYAIWYNAQAKLLHGLAPTGGSREVGSRSLMLDIHTHAMCQKYFSEKLSNELRITILSKYKRNFYKALFSFKNVRTKYFMLKKIKNRLSKS